MLDEELRTRLQALAAAGREEPGPHTLRAVRRRGRRKLGAVLAVPLVGVLVLAGALRLLPPEPDSRLSAVPATEPATFVGQTYQDGAVRNAVVDARTGEVRRWLPAVDLDGAAYQISPDLRTLYDLTRRDDRDCEPAWDAVDLATGARRPAFGGHGAGIVPTPSPDGRQVAFFACLPRPGLAVLDVASGDKRVWTIPADVEMGDWPLQWSQDSTRLGYMLRRAGEPKHRQVFHALPLEGTSSVTHGNDLPLTAGQGCELALPPRFRGTERVLVAENCPDGGFLLEYDLGTGRRVARTALGLAAEVFHVAVDRTGRHLLLLAVPPGKSTQKRPPLTYVVRGGRAEQVPNVSGCWMVAW